MLGSNHLGMREFNERVVLHAIRLHGSLPKAELAKLPARYTVCRRSLPLKLVSMFSSRS